MRSVENPVLPIYPDLKAMESGKNVDRLPHSDPGVVVAEQNAAGLQHLEGVVDVHPGGVEVVGGVHLHKVAVHPPVAEAAQRGGGGEGEHDDGVGGVGLHHVLHELVHQQAVPIHHLQALLLVVVPGPPPEIVDANDLGVDPQFLRQRRHVGGGGAEEGADLDDGAGADLVDEVLEDGGGGAPALGPLLPEEGADVRRREGVPRRGAVEDAVEDGLADVGGGDGAGALGGEAVVLEDIAGGLGEEGVGVGEVAEDEGEDEEDDVCPRLGERLEALEILVAAAVVVGRRRGKLLLSVFRVHGLIN